MWGRPAAGRSSVRAPALGALGLEAPEDGGVALPAVAGDEGRGLVGVGRVEVRLVEALVGVEEGRDLDRRARGRGEDGAPRAVAGPARALQDLELVGVVLPAVVVGAGVGVVEAHDRVGALGGLRRGAPELALVRPAPRLEVVDLGPVRRVEVELAGAVVEPVDGDCRGCGGTRIRGPEGEGEGHRIAPRGLGEELVGLAHQDVARSVGRVGWAVGEGEGLRAGGAGGGAVRRAGDAGSEGVKGTDAAATGCHRIRGASRVGEGLRSRVSCGASKAVREGDSEGLGTGGGSSVGNAGGEVVGEGAGAGASLRKTYCVKGMALLFLRLFACSRFSCFSRSAVAGEMEIVLARRPFGVSTYTPFFFV